MRPEAGAAAGPLSGIRVVDLGQVYNGPYCTVLLERLGAEIWKIEPPDGEVLRGRSAGTINEAFSLLNGGKQSVAVDLKTDAGRDLLLGLVRRADVLVENFAPGVMDRLGLGFDRLTAANPGLVIASGKAFGSGGPYESYRGMDLTVQAIAGVLSATGFPDQPPVKSGAAVADFSAGTHLAVAVLAALLERTRTGHGSIVEVSMHDAVVPMLASGLAAAIEGHGTKPERTGNHHGGLEYAPYGVYPTLDGWIAVLCLTNRHWQSLIQLMGLTPEQCPAAWQDNPGRVRNMAGVDEFVGSWTSQQRRDDLNTRLQQAGVPAAPVKTLSETLVDPQLIDRGLLGWIGPAGGERHLALGNPIRFIDAAGSPLADAPRLGQSTVTVLQAELGLDDTTIATLVGAGVIIDGRRTTTASTTEDS